MGVRYTTDNQSAGTFWDGSQIEVVNARFGVYEFGKTGQRAPGFILTYMIGADQQEDYWSYGDRDQSAFKPSEDGKTLEQIGTRTKLNERCSFIKFYNSLVDAGLDESKVPEDGSVDWMKGMILVGAEIPNKDSNKEDSTVRVVDHVIKWPWERTDTPTASSSGADIDEDALSVLVAECITEAGGTITKTALVGKIRPKVAESEDFGEDKVKAAIHKVMDANFLNSSDLWSFDKGKLTEA